MAGTPVASDGVRKYMGWDWEEGAHLTSPGRNGTKTALEAGA